MYLTAQRLLYRVVFSLILLSNLVMIPVTAQDRSHEYKVKAGFLFNLARLTEWPESVFSTEDAPFKICFLGDADIFGEEALNTIANKEVRTHSIELNYKVRADEAKSCQIFFIHAIPELELKKILESFADLPVLTVADSEGFARHGVMVNLVSQENRIALEINLKLSKLAGLKISARVLKLAKIIE